MSRKKHIQRAKSWEMRLAEAIGRRIARVLSKRGYSRIRIQACSGTVRDLAECLESDPDKRERLIQAIDAVCVASSVSWEDFRGKVVTKNSVIASETILRHLKSKACSQTELIKACQSAGIGKNRARIELEIMVHQGEVTAVRHRAHNAILYQLAHQSRN